MTQSNSTRRRQFIATSASVALPVAAGCLDSSSGGGGASVEETSNVSMTGSQFRPRNIHVDAGTAVTWANQDSTRHTVTSASDNWSFDETVSGGGSLEHTFDESGVYDVYCRLHGSSDLSGMSMKIGVGDATIESPVGGGDGGGGGAYGRLF